MMSLTRNYGVKLEGNFATLVVGTVLLEGEGNLWERLMSRIGTTT
jgi:hypothetical protein